MRKNIYTLILLISSLGLAYAGNPDRQGEAGATELLLNPWARSAGVHTMSTSYVTGAESMRVNVAGMSRINSGEFVATNTRLYEGSTMGMNALAFVTKMNKGGALGVSFTSLSFGDIPITTTDQYDGTGGTYSPGFFNLAAGYSHTFEKSSDEGGRISVGALVRLISESLPDVNAFGYGIDAGVQYSSGIKDNFKLGITLRNVGSPMRFGGEGLSFQTPNSETGTYVLTVDQRSEDFELPTVLDIGLSYDFYLSEDNFLRALGNFTSNAFARDQIGVGAEFSFRNMVILRAAYKYDLGEIEGGSDIYTGIAAGVSIDVPLKRASNQRVGIDYAYRTTDPYKGTHNFGLRFAF